MTRHNFFVHRSTFCQSKKIGAETNIWAFCNVLEGAVIGKECNICDHVFIENDVVIGDRVTIKCGVQIWDGISILDDVFIGPNATFSNDKYPASKCHLEHYPKTIIEKGASVGANATILPGVTIGMNSLVGAGAVVTHNVPPNAVVIGNPAKIVRYINNDNEISNGIHKHQEVSEKVANIGVGQCQLWTLPNYGDNRGDIMVNEFVNDLPFTPKRNFFVYNVPSDKIRGEHAHHQCKQFLVVLSGTVSIVVDDGNTSKEITLNTPEQGLYLAPKVWGIQYKFSKNTILCVYASHEYDDNDYIRDYNDFLNVVN